MRTTILIFVAFIAAPLNATPMREVVIATVHGPAAARREVLRAARKLDLTAAWDTTYRVPTKRTIDGPAIAARRGHHGTIVVSSYLGEDDDVDARLREARRFYPSAMAVAVSTVDEPDGYQADWSPAGVLVVSSHRSYAEALRAARAFERKADMRYDSRGMVFDPKRGLIWPDGDEDEMWAGAYAPRRHDMDCGPDQRRGCVTVERSERYYGFAPDLYIVVAGIIHDPAEEDSRLAGVKRYAPSAYLKQTILYMGCMH
jgi:hypothetical protein